MEHRCGYRRTVTARVLIRTPNGVSATAALCNISASGALLRTNLPASLHAVVSVGFRGRDFRTQYGRRWVSAHIVRQADGGLAVEWTEFSPEVVREVLLSMTKDDAVAVDAR